MFHWPWGPSIFQPDWSTGQMPERSSGTESSHVNMERGGRRAEVDEGGGCVIVFLYVIFVDVFLRNKYEKMGGGRRRRREEEAGFDVSPFGCPSRRCWLISQHESYQRSQGLS